jgi:outer membrane immunogenic protein
MGIRVLAAGVALLLGAFGAGAADLPMRAAPPLAVPPPVFSWSGCNIGTLTGYAWSDRNTVRTSGTTPGGVAAVGAGTRPAAFRLDYDGFTSIGGGIGCDWQFNPGNGVVVGIAADGTWMDLTRGRAYTGPGPIAPESGFRQSLDTLGTVRARVGYGFDRVLVYATGGFGFGNVEYRAGFFTGPRGTVLSQAGRFDGIETGYVVGGGIEYAIPEGSFLNNFSLLRLAGIVSSAPTIKVEYLRYDLGSRTIAVAPQLVGAPGYASRFSTEGNLIRGGFTYRFGL